MELIITNVSKTYVNGTQALRNINLSVSHGLFGLLGPNGAGKSTLMRTIATLQEQDTGEIRFNDIDIKKDKMTLRKHLGFLPQEFGIYPEMTAEAMLHHIGILKGLIDKKKRSYNVLEMLDRTNLLQYRNKRLDSFSGGMKQRFGIAQALLGNPQLVIVDEPTAGLDPEERTRFLNILSDISDSIIVILSTHIVEDVEQLCSNMAVIHNGKIIVSSKPKHAIENITGKIWSKTINKNELPYYDEHHTVLYTALQEGKILLHIFAEKNPLNGFEKVFPDLKDVYFTAVKELPVRAHEGGM